MEYRIKEITYPSEKKEYRIEHNDKGKWDTFRVFGEWGDYDETIYESREEAIDMLARITGKGIKEKVLNSNKYLNR